MKTKIAKLLASGYAASTAAGIAALSAYFTSVALDLHERGLSYMASVIVGFAVGAGYYLVVGQLRILHPWLAPVKGMTTFGLVTCLGLLVLWMGLFFPPVVEAMHKPEVSWQKACQGQLALAIIASFMLCGVVRQLRRIATGCGCSCSHHHHGH